VFDLFGDLFGICKSLDTSQTVTGDSDVYSCEVLVWFQSGTIWLAHGCLTSNPPGFVKVVLP